MSNYPLRLPKDLMEDVRRLAADQGVSVNQFLAATIAERVGELKALSRIQLRAGRGDAAFAMAVLRRAPDVAPLPGDEQT